jgi:hypothetical protein
MEIDLSQIVENILEKLELPPEERYAYERYKALKKLSRLTFSNSRIVLALKKASESDPNEDIQSLAEKILSTPVHVNFIKEKPELLGAAIKENNFQSGSEQIQPQLQPMTTSCQFCGDIAPTQEVILKQIVGFVFGYSERKVEGYLCRECIENIFWRFTGTTLFVGWWGFKSFFKTLECLFANITTYLSASDLEKPGVRMRWKALHIKIGLLILILWFGTALILDNIRNQQQVANSTFEASINTSTPTITTTPSLVPTILPTKNHTLTPSPNKPDRSGLTTPTGPDSCTRWDKISMNDVGKFMCVYGTVISTDETSHGFYMMFSNSTNRFHFVSFDYIFFDIENNCVVAEGFIKHANLVPLLVVEDELYKCDW